MLSHTLFVFAHLSSSLIDVPNLIERANNDQSSREHKPACEQGDRDGSHRDPLPIHVPNLLSSVACLVHLRPTNSMAQLTTRSSILCEPGLRPLRELQPPQRRHLHRHPRKYLHPRKQRELAFVGSVEDPRPQSPYRQLAQVDIGSRIRPTGTTKPSENPTVKHLVEGLSGTRIAIESIITIIADWNNILPWILRANYQKCSRRTSTCSLLEQSPLLSCHPMLHI